MNTTATATVERVAYSLNELAELLNVKVDTVRHQALQGRLVTVRLGGKHLVPAGVIRGLLAESGSQDRD